MDTKLNLHLDTAALLIQSYADGKIKIRNTEYTNSLIVTPAEVISWPLNTLSALDTEKLLPIFRLDFRPEMVILGTGETLCFPSAQQTRSLIDAQIGLEIMDTAAACRTFNVLADDGREIVACLLL